MSSNTPRIAPAPPRPSDPVSPDSNDSNLPGPSKRKSEALSAPKKRARVSYSCQECHRRKQKCDRQVPCGHCVARKVPELCKNYQPGKTEDFSARLARIEHIIEIALPQYANADFTNPPSPLPLSASLPGQIHESPNGHDLSTNGIWNHPSLQQPNDLDMTVNPSDRDRARSVSSSPSGSHKEEEHEPSGGTLQSGRWFGTSALGSVNEHPILDQLQSNPALQPVIEDASISDRLKSLVQDCGVPPHQLSELVQDLPPKPLSDVLIDHYFASVNYTRYPLHEPSFRNNYESVCQNGMNVQLNDIRFLPLLFVVLAIAARLAPENILGDDRQRRITSLRYYWSSRKSLLISCAVQTDSFEMILLRLLSIRFLTFDRRITECWAQLGAAVRTAHALGLHRDPAKMGLDTFTIEYRRRIWSYLYHADSTFALILGRPKGIHDAYCDTQPPLNVEDSEIIDHIRSHQLQQHQQHHPAAPPPLLLLPPLNPHPRTIPTQMTFTILRHQLASIVGHIVHHFQQIRPHTHYSEVLQLDDKLMSFLNTLPPHYSLEPDTSLDEVKSFIPVHRFLIITEVFFTRISLNRPYILRKLDSDKFLPSRRACIDSAKRDFLIRQAFKRTSSKCVLEAVGGSYREFQSAMISGIALAIDPFGPDAPAMHEILDVFLSERELLASKQGKELDETTKREMKIIEFLSMKAKNSELRKGPSQRQNSMNGEAEDEEDGLRSSGEQQSAERSSLMLRRAQGNVTRSSFGSQDAANANLLLGLGQDHRALPKLDVGRLSNGVPPPLGSPSLNTVIGSSSSTTTSFVGTHSRTPSNAVSRTGGNNVGSPMSHITPVATPSPKFPPTNAATNNPSILSPSWVRLNPPASNLGSPRINGVNHSSSSQTHPSSNLSHQRHVPESLASNSPAASAEEEAAQKLLDNWCNSNMDGGQGVGLSGFETGFGPFMGGNGASMMPLWNGNIGLGGSLNLSAGVADPRFGGSGGGLGLLGTTATTTAAPTPSSTTDVPQLNGMGSIANGDVATGIGDVPDWSYWENLVQHIRASGGMS